MDYILLFVSILMESGKNIFSNHFSKTKLNTLSDAIMFNIICSIGSLVFCLFMPLGEISSYSFLMAVLFSFTTTGLLVFLLLAMKSGPMSYSMLFSYLGMIISTVFGIIYNRQSVSSLQIAGFVLMIVTFWLGTDKSANDKFSFKWLFYSVMSFISCGFLGVIQLLHQSSPYKDEINVFMVVSFIASIVLSVVIFAFCKKGERKEAYSLIKSSMTIVGMVSGVFYGAVNIINLGLSGRMPAIIFFPVVNGGVLVLSSLAAIMLFREKPTVKQAVGIISGILAVCLLGI